MGHVGSPREAVFVVLVSGALLVCVCGTDVVSFRKRFEVDKLGMIGASAVYKKADGQQLLRTLRWKT